MSAANLIAIITAVTALVGAIGGVVGLILHKNGPAHQAPAPAQQGAKQ